MGPGVLLSPDAHGVTRAGETVSGADCEKLTFGYEITKSANHYERVQDARTQPRLCLESLRDCHVRKEERQMTSVIPLKLPLFSEVKQRAPQGVADDVTARHEGDTATNGFCLSPFYTKSLSAQHGDGPSEKEKKAPR